jgi:hypothetical protein
MYQATARYMYALPPRTGFLALYSVVQAANSNTGMLLAAVLQPVYRGPGKLN